MCKPFKNPRNRFPSYSGPTTLFVVPAHQATLAGGIDSSESIPGGFLKVYKYWLLLSAEFRPVDELRCVEVSAFCYLKGMRVRVLA
jgi:hypothetical protein